VTDSTPRGITFQPDIYDKVLGVLPRDRALRILDVGAGEGYFSRMLRDAGHIVTACDFNEAGYKCPDIPFLQADLNRAIPAQDGAFDCAVAIEVIEHIENHFRFVSEMARVVKAGGILVITTPNVLSIPSRWHFFLYGFTDCAPLPLDPDHPDPLMQHVNPIALPQLLFHLERAGAELIDLTTNRRRRSAWLPMLLYPLFAAAIRAKLLRPRHAAQRALYKRHIRWLLSRANLMGRITIAVARVSGRAMDASPRVPQRAPQGERGLV
jgi:SAM-dependent methyltransferase